MSDDRANDDLDIFKALWQDKDYLHSTEVASNAAVKFAPLLTKVATAVDIRCCGSLGTRFVVTIVMVVI